MAARGSNEDDDHRGLLGISQGICNSQSHTHTRTHIHRVTEKYHRPSFLMFSGLKSVLFFVFFFVFSSFLPLFVVFFLIIFCSTCGIPTQPDVRNNEVLTRETVDQRSTRRVVLFHARKFTN